MNQNHIGKFFIIKDTKFSDYMKDKDNNLCLYDTYDEALDVCWIYEFPDALICEVKANYKESE
jgi:hypothetical protein